ncbi:MAG TPA: putative quinol monooxygenase [Candidatus Baltobacteraceae bacterium]|jgi:quinol monooxygenase YgiN|nr:putative quinol monooxygenase [Candidatus Baltobacteraceae bacterium]
MKRKYVLLVRFSLREGAAEDFDALVAETKPLIDAQEPDTLSYDCYRSPRDPNLRVFHEVYRDEGAFRFHECRPHVRRFLERRERYLAAPPLVERLESLSNDDL